MGNYRFRLSDMMPNAWFYKLKDMSRSRNQKTIHSTKKKYQQTSSFSSSSAASSEHLSKARTSNLSHQRKSYYFARDLSQTPNHDRFDNNLVVKPKVSDIHYPEPPRKSSKKRRSTKRSNSRASPRLVTSSVSAGCSCRATLDSVWTKPDSTPEDYPNSPLDSSSERESLLPEFGSDRGLTPDTFDGMLSLSSCRCHMDNDIVIDMERKLYDPNHYELDNFHSVPEIDLPPIVTKPSKFNESTKDAKKMENNEAPQYRRSSAKFEERDAYGSLSVKVVKEDYGAGTKEQRTSPVRKLSVHSPGVKLRTNSPRIVSRKIQGRKSVSSSSSSSSRKSVSLSESFAVVKSSQDPQRDFRESMVEMIIQNNIRASKDLEDLLACYLSLNSDEYHDLIIKVFKQLWFDIIDVRLK